MKRTISTLPLVAALALLGLVAPCSMVRAGWYGENVERGADIVIMELRYPRWPKHGLYFSCWNMVMLPEGGNFYGGVQSFVRSDRPEDQSSYRPRTCWSLWSDPSAYGEGDVVRNVFMHPEVYASMQVQYGGEGTSGGCGAARGASWIRNGHWYRMVMRVWSPVGGSDKESFAGWWIKDVSKNAWYHHATYRIPTRVTGFSGNAGFLECCGCSLKEIREVHRRLGYYRLNGVWRKSDTTTINVPPDHGGATEYRTVRLLENNTVLSLKETADPKIGGNLEPGRKHAFTVKQPAKPVLDPLEVTGVKATLYHGQIAVSWEIPPHASPQLGYRIEVFDNPDFQGAPQVVHAARFPHVRQTRLDTKLSNPSVRLVVTDIYDRETAVTVPVESKATLLPAISIKAIRPGLNYQYFEQTDDNSDKAKRWRKLPDFEKVKPKLQGIARGLDADFRENRSTKFAFRYRGLLRVPSSGLYTLVLKSCDGSRIRIDGRLVLDNDGLHSATERRATVALAKGLHRFECDWFRGYVPGHKEWAGLWLGWERPGGGLEEIPISAWCCEDVGDIPTITLVVDEPAKRKGNMLRIRPQIDARGASISRVAIFQGNLLWGETSEAPFEISGFLSAGANRLRARLYYSDGRTVDDPRIVELKGIKADLSPWILTVQGQPGLPHGFRMRQGMLDFVGEGEYFAHQKIRGDFTLTCRVDHVRSKAAGADPASWMGLLVKETDRQHQGDYFGIYQTAGVGLRGSPDTSDIIGSRMSTLQYAKDHPWLRVVRRGNVFASYSSPDGKNWTKATEWIKRMREELFAGLSARTIPYRSRALFRGRLRNATLKAGAPPPDAVRPAKGLKALGPCISGLAQSVSQPAMLVARTTHNGLLISKDRGGSWRAANAGREGPAALAVRSVAIHPRDPNIILCATGLVGADGKLESGLWRSADGGKTWRLVTKAIDFDGRGPTRFCGEVVAFDPNRPEVVMAAGETRGIFISRDTGRTWKPLGLNGERITCVVFHPLHKPGYLVVGTCADVELRLFGLGLPAKVAPKADRACLYVTRDHGRSWDRRAQRKAFGVTNIALRETYWDLIVLATTRGIYTSENLAYTLYQRMEGIERDTPYTALGTDGRYVGILFYAAPLSSTKANPVVSSGNWQRWHALPGVPAGARVVAIKTDVANPRTLFIVRTDGILQSRPGAGVKRIYP